MGKKSGLLMGCAATALWCGGIASAQTATVPATTANDPSLPQSSEPAPAAGEVVVTGSRLRDLSFAAPSPLQVLTAEGAAERGLVTTTEIVQETPATGSTQQNESASNGRPSANGGGATAIDLRGLGAARTLVLLNGHRVGPAGSGGTIAQFDLSLLPSAMLSRVEILTNGASAIYGSDAVAGVVNIITREDFDGGRISLNGTASQDGGGNYINASVRYGHRFNRGALSLGAAYTETKILRARQRDFTACDADYVFNPDGSRADITNPDGSYKCWGVGYLYKYAGTGTNSSVGSAAGYLRPSDATVGTTTTSDLNGYTRIRLASQSLADRYNGFYPESSGGLTSGDQSVISPSRRYSLFASGNFQLSPDVELYGDALATRRDSRQEYLRYFQAPTINASQPNNPFNFANNPAYVDSAGRPLRPATSTVLFQFQQVPQQQVDYGTFTLGARGKIGRGWDFDVYANYSRSDATYSQNFVYADRLAAANSASGCDTTKLVTTTSCPAGSIDFWRAYEDGFTQVESDWLIGRSVGQTTYEQMYVDASVSGAVFSLPAGEVKAAFGAHVRREQIDDQPGDTTNFDTSALNYYLSAKPTVGSADVREGYAELGVPLLRNAAFAKQLNLSLSGRLSNFEYGGTSATYKSGLAWRPVDWLLVRATQGTSFRQPKLYELFLQDQSALAGRTSLDACNNYTTAVALSDIQRSRCSQLFGGQNYVATGNATMVSGGSTSLDPETARTRTVGFVLSPGLLNANLSVDFYDINLSGRVTRLGAATIVSECLQAADYPNGRYCALVTRDSSNILQSVTNNYLNAGDQIVRGLDIAYSLSARTAIGQIGSDGQFNVQFKNAQAVFDGDPLVDYAGYSGTPKFLGNVGIWYRPVRSVLVRLSAKLVGRMSNENYFTGASPTTALYRDTGQTVTYDRVNDFYANFGLSATARIDKDLDVSFGIRNLLNTAPPLISTGGVGYQQYREGTASTLSFYDLIGRTFHLTVSRNF